jgi:dolichol-phosphate mannosyltransferase
MISIIIPIYNEQEMLKQYNNGFFPVVEELSARGYGDFEIVFVDDRSSDASWQSISDFINTRKDCSGIRHERNRGMGGALKTGLQNSHGDMLVFLDADLTFRPGDISILLDEYKRSPVDCVSGSPYLRPELMEDVQKSRMILSKCVNILYRALLGRQVTSISPIFRLYRKSVFDQISISSENFEINAEILSKMIFKGMKISEVPVALHERRFGESKARLAKSIKNHITILYRIFIVKYLGREWS